MAYGAKRPKKSKKAVKNTARKSGMNKHPAGPGPMCNGGNGKMC